MQPVPLIFALRQFRALVRNCLRVRKRRKPCGFRRFAGKRYKLSAWRTVGAVRKRVGGTFLASDRSGCAARTPQFRKKQRPLPEQEPLQKTAV